MAEHSGVGHVMGAVDAGVGNSAGIGLRPSASNGARREIKDDGVGQVPGTARPDDAVDEDGAAPGPGGAAGEAPPQPRGPGGKSELGGPTET